MAATGSKSILVTGASTGFGRALTESLSAKGHMVFAGARKQKDREALHALANVRPLQMDFRDSPAAG